ncbi:MAG: PAS domain S-box protein [bacterium]
MNDDRVAAALPFLVDRSSDGHLLVEADGTVAFANVAAQTALAADTRVLVGSPLSRWLPQFDIRPGVPLPVLETTMVAATQDRFPVEIAVIVADDDDSGRSWVVFRDITARRGLEGSVRVHAEELEALVRTRTRDLDDLRARYLRLYDLAPILDIELDSQGAIASANRKVCLALGATIDHLVGVPLVDLAIPDQREALGAALKALREGSSVPFEARLRSREGAVIDVMLHGSRSDPSPRSGTRILGLDVTALREAEKQVDQGLDLAEAQRARMERILRGIGEGIVVTDVDGQVRLMNGLAERILAVDERFAFGRDLLSEQPDVEFVRRWHAFLAGPDDTARAELGLGGAQSRRYAVTFSRIKTSEGRPAACTALLHDVSAERRAERRARELSADLAQELRSSLVAVRGRVAAAEGAPEMVRMTRLVEDFVQLAKLEAGRDPVEPRSHELGAVVRDACVALGAGAAPCELKIGEGLAPAVIDPARTRRSLDLLLARAVRLTPAGRHVDVEVARRGARIEIRITDAGANEIDSARSSGSFRAAGTGLDLYLAQRLTEIQGGEFDLETRGVGSLVRLSFPVVQESASLAARPGAGADPLLDEPDEEFLAEGSAHD